MMVDCLPVALIAIRRHGAAARQRLLIATRRRTTVTVVARGFLCNNVSVDTSRMLRLGGGGGQRGGRRAELRSRCAGGSDWKELTIEPVGVFVLVIHRGGSHCYDCEGLIWVFVFGVQLKVNMDLQSRKLKVKADADLALCVVVSEKLKVGLTREFFSGSATGRVKLR